MCRRTDSYKIVRIQIKRQSKRQWADFYKTHACLYKFSKHFLYGVSWRKELRFSGCYMVADTWMDVRIDKVFKKGLSFIPQKLLKRKGKEGKPSFQAKMINF
jgi:hypothetical protein